MATFENTVTIQRPVKDVFAFLADFENLPTWNHAIVETNKTSHRDHQLPAGTDRPWDPPDQPCRPAARLGAIATPRSPGRLQSQDGSGGQPPHPQATPGNQIADVTSHQGARRHVVPGHITHTQAHVIPS
jgi:hypothetical protein